LRSPASSTRGGRGEAGLQPFLKGEKRRKNLAFGTIGSLVPQRNAASAPFEEGEGSRTLLFFLGNQLKRGVFSGGFFAAKTPRERFFLKAWSPSGKPTDVAKKRGKRKKKSALRPKEGKEGPPSRSFFFLGRRGKRKKAAAKKKKGVFFHGGKGGVFKVNKEKKKEKSFSK